MHLVMDWLGKSMQAVRLSLAERHSCLQMGDISCKLVSSWIGKWINHHLGFNVADCSIINKSLI